MQTASARSRWKVDTLTACDPEEQSNLTQMSLITLVRDGSQNNAHFSIGYQAETTWFNCARLRFSRRNPRTLSCRDRSLDSTPVGVSIARSEWNVPSGLRKITSSSVWLTACGDAAQLSTYEIR